MVIDGKKIADEVIVSLGEKLKGKTLGVVMNKNDAASVSFVKMKERIASCLGVTLERFSPEHMHEALLCDATIVQLPMVNAELLVAQIPPHKDVDPHGTTDVHATKMKLSYDVFYLKHRSATLDMSIFIKTIRRVLIRSNA